MSMTLTRLRKESCNNEFNGHNSVARDQCSNRNIDQLLKDMKVERKYQRSLEGSDSDW